MGTFFFFLSTDALVLPCPAQHATHTHTFAYSSSPPRKGSATDSEEVATSDSFGVETRGQVMLLELAKFNEMVDGLEGYVGAAAAVMDQS